MAWADYGLRKEKE
jgi:hypothetical protein